jgi:hypothetical protein
MNFLLSVIGFVLAITLIFAGVGYVFAPEAVGRLLRSVGMALGLALVASLVAWDLARAAGPFVSVLVAALVSVAAYAVRSRRAPRAERGRPPRSAERTPVMPRHLGEDL